MESHSFCLNKLSYGSHSNEWDLSVFLYKGAVLENRRTILNSIKANKYGGVLRERIEFVSNLFEYFDYRITIGLIPISKYNWIWLADKNYSLLYLTKNKNLKSKNKQ